MKNLEPEKGRKPKEFILNHMRFSKECKENYKELMSFLNKFSYEWVKSRQIKSAVVQYDETVNSVNTIKSRTKRAGKFEQHTYLVCFNSELGYGYFYNTRKHFQKTNRKDLEDFMRKVKLQDSNFNQHWIKDARTWGSSAQVKGMLETPYKKYTMDIERRFGWIKNMIYKTPKKEIKDQDTLEKMYRKAFATYNIIEIVD